MLARSGRLPTSGDNAGRSATPAAALVSPELVLVDPELAELERARLNKEALLAGVLVQSLLDELEVFVDRAREEAAAVGRQQF
jgi:ABC-type molybdate transport system ATPase subunit